MGLHSRVELGQEASSVGEKPYPEHNSLRKLATGEPDSAGRADLFAGDGVVLTIPLYRLISAGEYHSSGCHESIPPLLTRCPALFRSTRKIFRSYSS